MIGSRRCSRSTASQRRKHKLPRIECGSIDSCNRCDSDKARRTLIDRNVTLFHDKFAPRLLGREVLDNRFAHVIVLEPIKKYRVESRVVVRLMKQLSLKVWIDEEEYQVAKLEDRGAVPRRIGWCGQGPDHFGIAEAFGAESMDRSSSECAVRRPSSLERLPFRTAKLVGSGPVDG